MGALDRGRDGPGERRLARAGRVLQEQVAPGEHAREREPHDVLLAEDGLADVGGDPGEGPLEPPRVLLGHLF
jgi:hypothetical protein